MNKALNTVLFMVGATLLNLLLIVVIFVALIMLSSLILDNDSSSQMITIAYGLSIVLSIGGGFYLYNKIIKWVNKKWKLENYIATSFRKPKK